MSDKTDGINEDLTSIYETLIDNIVKGSGQCVLLLGPELCVNKEGEGYKSYFKKLAENNKKSVRMYFESENLFSFRDDAGETNIRRSMRKFYENVGDSVLLEMISQIPFPLIINVLPDISLNNVYVKKGIKFRPAYFSKYSKPDFINIETPTKDNPVIYNIFGTIEMEQTMILTHGKLYQTIEDLLSIDALPKKIFSFVENSNSFVFLGFKFDSWYYQLVCHKLKINGDKNSNLKTCLSVPHFENTPVSIVMKKHFKVASARENPEQIIQKIIDGCNEQSSKFLRTPSPQGNYSVFISYARKNETPENDNPINRESIVDLIEEELKRAENLIHVFKRNELTYGDSIDSFMNLIGKGKTVIRIVSDKYLKSVYCLQEAIRIKQYLDEKKRVFTVVLDDIELEDKFIGNYKNYWKEKLETRNKNIEENFKDIIEKERFKRKNDIYLEMYDFVDPFIKDFTNEIHLKSRSSDLKINEDGKVSYVNGKNEDFSKFIDLIINKIKEG